MGKGLQLSALEAGWEGISTPFLKTPEGYCNYNCNMCGNVCPTHAIQSLPLDSKQKIKMGTAHFNKVRCIPWTHGEICQTCYEHCPIPNKAIYFEKKEIISNDGKIKNILLPYVDESVCIGCGVCTSVCPVDGEKGIFVNNLNEKRYLS